MGEISHLVCLLKASDVTMIIVLRSITEVLKLPVFKWMTDGIHSEKLVIESLA